MVGKERARTSCARIWEHGEAIDVARTRVRCSSSRQCARPDSLVGARAGLIATHHAWSRASKIELGACGSAGEQVRSRAPCVCKKAPSDRIRRSKTVKQRLTRRIGQCKSGYL